MPTSRTKCSGRDTRVYIAPVLHTPREVAERGSGETVPVKVAVEVEAQCGANASVGVSCSNREFGVFDRISLCQSIKSFAQPHVVLCCSPLLQSNTRTLSHVVLCCSPSTAAV
jgi:hypothetical protein